MTTLRCLIIDDEIHCRHELRYLLDNQSDITVVGECGTIAQARTTDPALQPDLLFLDIHLGLHDGFELLQNLPSQPLTVFVTAFDCHAIRAFSVNALDYLLKPVQPDRLAETLCRARRRLTPGLSSSDKVFEITSPTSDLLVPLSGIGNATAIHDIMLIEARNHHSRVTLSSGTVLAIRRKMREWLSLLPGRMFMQVDRSMLINLDHVISVECCSRGGRLFLGAERMPVTIGRTGSARAASCFRTEASGWR
ncbi:MAG UNVERIFIED_CONTAM: DNA-binding response regulator [Planctomycetaceae bacterium]|jgi:two-component system LytT family response regulator